MKRLNLIVLLAAGVCLNANAGLWYSSGTLTTSAPIPDGTSAGLTTSTSFSGITGTITDVSVTLNISGGFNGDLYGYLSHNGVLVPLLNRVGVQSGDPLGYDDSGFAITLSSSALNDVHFYRNYTPTMVDGKLTGTWQPDGRDIDPLSAPATLAGANRMTFESYDNKDANGTWTMFFADMSSGGSQSQLVSWQLDVQVVPEPANVALGIFGMTFVIVGFWKNKRVQAFARRAFVR